MCSNTELVAFGAKAVIRLGTNDYNVTSDKDVYIVQKCHGLLGLMQDYGIDQSYWGTGITSDASLVQELQNTAKKYPEIASHVATGYNIDAFYSFFDPDRVAANPDAVRALQHRYEN